MKRFLTLIVVAAVMLATTQAVAHAQEAPQPAMNDAMLAHIRDVCSTVQANLNRLHASDALLRVNQGQALLAISNRLMTPLNSRIAINQLDGGKMTSITSNYVTQFDAFSVAYQQYEEAMTRAMQTDCKKQPAAFYTALTDARTKRTAVHDRMLELRKSLTDYETEFTTFTAGFKGKAQ